MEKRAGEGLLANMWQFIMIEREENKDSLKTVEQRYGVIVNQQLAVPILNFKHVFSHLKWHVESYLVDAIEVTKDLKENSAFFTKEQIESLPMPVPMLKIWERLK